MLPVFSTETGLMNPVMDFETGFTPWDSSELLSIIQSPLTPGSSEPNSAHSGSDQVVSEEIKTHSGSDRTTPELDERKRKRKMSNRESAKRSRVRKQRHLENMRIQVNRLKFENKELVTRLRFALYQCEFVRTENDRLRLEHSFLKQKLSDLRQLLLFRQLQQQLASATWPCINTVAMTEQNASLITNQAI